MTEKRNPPAPSRLKTPGRRLWKSVVKSYTLRPDELFVLENACRSCDLIEDLDVAMEGQPLIVKGSMGQERENPLLSEQRQQRMMLNRSLAQLKLPDLDAAGSGEVNLHRKAGLSRWAQAHGTG